MNSCRDQCASTVRLCSILVFFSLVWSSLPTATLADGGTDKTVDLGQLEDRVDRLVWRVTELAGTDDVLDTLHFGWFDRPYARATLAILVKTTHVLQREIRLRRRQNGAIVDADLFAMLTWTDSAIQRVSGTWTPTDFRPDRLRVTGDELVEAPSTPALFAYIDRATATRYHRTFGDLDLLAAMGNRVYGRIDRDCPGGESERTLVERANALGMAVVVAASRQPGQVVDLPPLDHARPVDPRRGRCALYVQPLTLRMFWGQAPSTQHTPGRSVAVIDPPFGEPWASSLARRALARGVLARTRFVSGEWSPPLNRGSGVEGSGRIAAAMWVHAIEGQSLGLLRGWRDFRDGSLSPSPSVFVDPAGTEIITRTALDLVRLGRYITPFRVRPSLAVAVGSDAVDPHDDNAWAPWIKAIWAELLDRQIRFDVVISGSDAEQLRRRYRSVFTLRSDDADNIGSVLLRLDRLLSKDLEHVDRLTVRESDGSLATEVFVRSALTPQGRPCVAVVNLSGRSRRLTLEGGPRLGLLRDVIADTPIQDPREGLTLQPWQARLLWAKK